MPSRFNRHRLSSEGYELKLWRYVDPPADEDVVDAEIVEEK